MGGLAIAMQPLIESGLAHVLLGTVVVVSYPVVVLFRFSKKRKWERDRGLRRRVGPLPSKLPRRRRALTLVSGRDLESQCPLISALPFEIRQIIWKECLTGVQFHIRVYDGQIRGFICSSMQPHLCYGPGMSKGCHVLGSQSPFDRGTFNGISILQSCRTM